MTVDRRMENNNKKHNVVGDDIGLIGNFGLRGSYGYLGLTQTVSRSNLGPLHRITSMWLLGAQWLFGAQGKLWLFGAHTDCK